CALPSARVGARWAPVWCPRYWSEARELRRVTSHESRGLEHGHAEPEDPDPTEGVRLSPDRPVGSRDRRDRQAHGRGGQWTGAPAHTHRALRRVALSAREQDFA